MSVVVDGQVQQRDVLQPVDGELVSAGRPGAEFAVAPGAFPQPGDRGGPTVLGGLPEEVNACDVAVAGRDRPCDRRVAFLQIRDEAVAREVVSGDDLDVDGVASTRQPIERDPPGVGEAVESALLLGLWD